MKNKFNLFFVTAIALSMLLSGCESASPEAKEATEFLNDETGDGATSADSSEDMASEDRSIIVVDKLIEPLFEEDEQSSTDNAAGSDGSTDSGKEEKTDSGKADDSDKSEDESGDKSTDKSADKSTDKATDKSADKSSDKSTDKTTDKSSDKSASKDTSKSKSKSKTKKAQKESSSDEAKESEKEKKDDKIEIVFFGDSQIAGGRKDGTDIASYVANRVPNSVVYNLGIGGTTGSVEESTTEINPSELHSSSFLGMTYCLAGESDREATLVNNPEVLETMNKVDPENVDYYFIEYGTNDFINNVPLDASTYATDGEQFHAFYNAMCKGIDVLEEISPNAQFIIMTPFYGIYVAEDGSYIGDSYIVSNGTGTLADYARKAINVTEDRELYYFDGMFISKCDLYLDTADKYLADNLHLNVTGRQIMGRLLAHYVNYLEKNEPYAYLEADFIKIDEFDPDENFRLDESIMKQNYPESWARYIKGEFPLAQPSEEALEKYGDD